MDRNPYISWLTQQMLQLESFCTACLRIRNLKLSQIKDTKLKNASDRISTVELVRLLMKSTSAKAGKIVTSKILAGFRGS